MRKESIAGKWCVWECKWNTFCIWNWNWNWRYLCEICWWLPLLMQWSTAARGTIMGRKDLKRWGRGVCQDITQFARVLSTCRQCVLSLPCSMETSFLFISIITPVNFLFTVKSSQVSKETFILSFHLIVIMTNVIKIILLLSISRQCYRWISPVINRHNYSSHFSLNCSEMVRFLSFSKNSVCKHQWGEFYGTRSSRGCSPRFSSGTCSLPSVYCATC